MLAGSLGRGIGRGRSGGVNHRSSGIDDRSRSAGGDGRRGRGTGDGMTLLVEQAAQAALLHRSGLAGNRSRFANRSRSRFASDGSRSAGGLLVEQTAEAGLAGSGSTRRGRRAGGDRLNVNDLGSRSGTRRGASLLGMTTCDRAHDRGNGETDHVRKTPCQGAGFRHMGQRPDRKNCPKFDGSVNGTDSTVRVPSRDWAQCRDFEVRCATDFSECSERIDASNP